MNIITFVFIIVASLGALFVGIMVFVKASTFLGLFFWNKVRSVQTIIKEKAEQKSKAVQQPPVVLEKIQEAVCEYAYLEIPTYIRKGKTLVW